MRHVGLNMVFDRATTDEVFDAVLRWELPAPEAGFSWEWDGKTVQDTPVATSGFRPRRLELATGALRWTEEIRSERRNSEIRFALVEGDFDELRGRWSFRRAGAGVAVRFEIDFDFGMPSMASIVDPVAETAITRTITRAVLGMMPPGRVEDDAVLLAAPKERAS